MVFFLGGEKYLGIFEKYLGIFGKFKNTPGIFEKWDFDKSVLKDQIY